MMPPIYINGRFLSQSLSGVQRFATEMTVELRTLYGDRLTVLCPPGARDDLIAVKPVGRSSGQVWEQLELPRFVRPGVLFNLGNTAPLSLQSQVVVIHDAGVFATPEAYSWKFRVWYKFLHSQLRQRRVAIATVSETARKELIAALGVNLDDVGVVSEGADHISRITPDRGILATLPPGPFVLVVGNLAAHKNLAALGVLAEDLAARNVPLVITGGLSGKAFQATNQSALPQPAIYTGRVSDEALKALYQQASCLVIPSRYEGFGLPALEAMTSGCAVVASRIPALEETCGNSAVYCDPANPADISAQVLSLLDDPTLMMRLRLAGLAHARMFTWQKAALRLAGIADGVAERQRRRAEPRVRASTLAMDA